MEKTELPVNPLWKWVATLTVGIVLGAAPGYVSLLIDHHTSVTIVDVDREITVQNAALGQSIADLKDEVRRLEDKIDVKEKESQQP